MSSNQKGGGDGGDGGGGDGVGDNGWKACLPDWRHPVESSAAAWSDGWTGPEVRRLMIGQLAEAAVGEGGRADITVVWMLRSHVEQVAQIQKDCYGIGSTEMVVEMAKGRGCIGTVLLDQSQVKGRKSSGRKSSGRRLLGEGEVLGYCMIEVSADMQQIDSEPEMGGGGFTACTRIIELGVRDDLRRCRVGTALVSRAIKGMLHRRRETSVVATVPERFLDLLLFYRALGFRADRKVRGSGGRGGGRGGGADGSGTVDMRWHKPLDPDELVRALATGVLPPVGGDG